MSDSDSEYDSEEDEDYVPDESASEEERIEFGEDESKRKKKGKGQGKSQKRKKKGGICLEEDEEPEEVSSEDEEPLEDLEAKEEKQKQEELSKTRVNDLWASFKRDTAAVRPSVKNTLPSKQDSRTETVTLKNVKDKPIDLPKASTTAKVVQKKVEITQLFDFAGEEVKVVKTVEASAIKDDPKNYEKTKTGDLTSAKPNSSVPLKRPSGGLGSVLGKIGKKPKISTLEKSKLDWQQFKKQEGIEDDLKSSNKDGFLEKQAFLNRVDYKQFEIERDIRQGVRKR